jgi:Zn-dependent M28 family amino/carboxypeptidase
MRRKLFCSYLIVVLLSASALAQTASNVEQNLRKHIEYLASAKLEGRRTGDPGATAAAKYVAGEYKKSRLKPGLKTTFLQPFPYISGVTLGADNSLRIVPSDKAWEVGVNWMPLGYSPNADIPATAIVFAGFGITAAEANYDDYKGLDVKDKIVLIFDNTPDAGNPHSPFARFDIHTKANIAKDKGAKAIILIAEDNDFKSDRLSRLSYDRTLGETAVPVVGISRAKGAELIEAKDEEGLRDIEKGLTAQAENRPVKTISRTAQIKLNLVKKQVDAYNVIGILPGRDPQLKNEAIIIGAHYDHLGHGGSGSLAANSTDIHYGADDNASGTSAVLELAREFAKEKKNKRTLIFMAFGGEEEGLLGSKYYVNNPVWPLEKTIAMINLDMVGRLNENKLTVGGIGTASDWKGIVEEFVFRQPTAPSDIDLKNRVSGALQAKGISSVIVEVEAGNVTLRGWAPAEKYAEAIRTVSEAGPKKMVNQVMKSKDGWNLFDFRLQLSEDGFGPSDHSSFYGKKIPVLFFFTGTHIDYHKPTDTADKINYIGLQRITNYVGQIARAVDQNPTKPTYAVAKSSTPMGQVRLGVSLGTIPSYGDTTDGMILDGVRDNSPASKAGLKAGDKIVKLAGKDVRNAMDYTYVLGSMKPGEEYEVELIRGTERMTLKIVPAAAPTRP